MTTVRAPGVKVVVRPNRDPWVIVDGNPAAFPARFHRTTTETFPARNAIFEALAAGEELPAWVRVEYAHVEATTPGTAKW